MQIFSTQVPFVFNYPSAGQVTGLNIAASIYDVTSGSPVFVSISALSDLGNGFYSGNYIGSSQRSYLVIILNYQDSGHTLVDPTFAPWADCYKSADAPASYFFFNYGAFDQESGLFVAGNVYDCSTGTPVFLSQVPMAHVLGGVYFGSINGSLNHSYDISKWVYQDSGFTSIDSNWPPGSETISLFTVYQVSEIIFLGGVLVGQSLNASLIGQKLEAILEA